MVVFSGGINKPVRFSNMMYNDAIDYFNDEMCMDIEDDYIRDHAEELILCYSKNRSIVDFDAWTCFEDLVGERISFEEYSFLNEAFNRDVLEVYAEDEEDVFFIKRLLKEYRISCEDFRK